LDDEAEVRRAAGLDVSTPDAGVISVTAPSADAAVAGAAACRERGVAVGCFGPPSTPDGRSRLRLTVNVGIPARTFDDALDTVVKTAP
jgi:8-amino-7-oxononanoate synthase